MKWTRKIPDRNGRWWCAQRFSDENFYRIKLVDVFGCQSSSKIEPHGTPFWGGALPLTMMANYDLWWAAEPVEEPEPPEFKASRRKPME